MVAEYHESVVWDGAMPANTEYRQKIVHPHHVVLAADRLRAQGKRIVLVAGTFNPFREHHDDLNRQAAERGVVFASTNSDRSLRRYRGGQNRSDFLFPLWYRLKRIAECPHVTYVTWYDDVNAAEVIRNIKPGIFLRGPDYKNVVINPLELIVAGEVGTVNMLAHDNGKKPLSAADLERSIADFQRAVEEGHAFDPYAHNVMPPIGK